MRDVPPKAYVCKWPGEYDEQKQANIRKLKIT